MKLTDAAIVIRHGRRLQAIGLEALAEGIRIIVLAGLAALRQGILHALIHAAQKGLFIDLQLDDRVE